MKDNNAFEKFVPREVTYDPSLDAYTDVVLFPEKLARAQELLENCIVPNKKTRISKTILTPPLTDLQKELLQAYTLEPSEQQMAALKAFLAQLFSKTTLSQTVETE